MISVQGLTVRFGGVYALDDLSLELGGDIAGVIGPNGAGKTTLLNVLSGFLVPQAGSATIDGVDILAMPPARRARWGLGRTFQSELLVDELPVYDNVVAACHEHGRRDRDAVGHILSLLGLADVEDEPAARLTSFQRRLVELARSAVNSPKLILMDEPGGGLATHESDVLRRIILSLPAGTGAKVLVIDHDVDLIAATCTETACLDFGKLVVADRTEIVLNDARVRSAYLGIDDEVTA